MKRLVSFVLSIVMLFTMLSVTGFAVEAPLAFGAYADSMGGELYWELSEDGGTLTLSGKGSIGAFTQAPEWLAYSFTRLVVEKGVTAIPEEAFLGAKDLEAVELADTVTVIGQRAFYGCESLKTVDFNNTLVIGAMAFYGCVSYKDVKIPEAVEEIGSYAIGYYCDEALDIELAKITDVVIFADGNKAAKKYAEEYELSLFDSTDYTDYFNYTVVNDDCVLITEYYGCKYSDEIIIPSEIDGKRVCEIADYVFTASDVKSVYIPSTVEQVNAEAFENADKLEAIICEKGGKYISVDGCLYNEDGYILLKVPEAKIIINQYSKNIRTIYENAFRNSAVKEVVLPETVVNIRGYSFAFSGVEKILIPKNVTLICEFAFYGSENLKEVVLPKGLDEIEANAFGHCSSLTEINLPYGLTCIEGSAFHCSGIKSVVIPTSVTRITDYAFGYYSADDIEFVKDETFEIRGGKGTAAEKYATANGFKFTDASPAQPKILSVNTDKISVTLFWEKVKGVDGYEIYRKTNKTAFKKIAEVGAGADAVYSDLAVKNGDSYTYAVVSVKDNYESSYDSSVTVDFIRLDTPKLVSAEMTSKGICVKWKTVSNAQGYILYRKTEETEWEEIAYLKGSIKSYVDTTCKSGETYSYTVKAYNGEVEGGCNYAGVSALFLSVPKLKSAFNATKGIKITWEKVKGAKGYIISRKTSSSGWSKIAEVKNVSEYIDKKAKAGTTYTYTVTPISGDVKGLFNEKGVTYKRLSKVTTEEIENTADGVKITWKPVSKCTGYKVYRKTEKGSYKRIATVKNSKKSYYIDKKASSGTKYTYKVVAYSGDYVSYYTELSRYYLEEPKLVSAKSGKKGVTAKWEKTKGASGYYVYRKEGSGKYKKLATVKGGAKKSYLDTKAKKGKTYTYKVKAYYSKTTSAYSNTKKVKDKY